MLLLTSPNTATASTSTLAPLGKAPTCQRFWLFQNWTVKSHHLKGCPCRRVLLEERSVDRVHRREVLDVLEQHGGLHNMPVVAASSLQEVSHVDQSLPRLLFHSVHQLPIRLHCQHHQHQAIIFSSFNLSPLTPAGRTRTRSCCPPPGWPGCKRQGPWGL